VTEHEFLAPELTRYWRFYLILESELETALRFVEPDPDNCDTFSLEFARQLLATCAHFETVAKLLCERQTGSRPEGIQRIRTALLQTSPGLTAWGTRFLPLNRRIAPFANWSDLDPPSWWTACNKIKHDPAVNIRDATLSNATSALLAAGLVTVRYLDTNAQPGRSRLFDLSAG